MASPNVVVIGASAGGLGAVSTILRALPHDFAAAVFVVIHLAAEQGRALAEVLSRASSLPIVVPKSGEPIRPGRVYLPPRLPHPD